MHITAKKEDLIEVLSVVERALPVRSSIPVIKGILLDAKEDLTFTANNLELAIKGKMSAEIWEGGKVVLPEKFKDIVRQLPDTQVEIKIDSLNAEVKSGNSVFTLHCIDAEEYPINTESAEGWNTIQLTSEQLRNILIRTLFAVSVNEHEKPYFKGILWEMQNGDLLAMASDTYRLAEVKEGSFENEDFRIVVPGKNIQELLRILGEGTVNAYFTGSEMIVAYKQYTFYFRLLEDKYPNFRNAFPVNYDTKIKINAELLERVLSRAALITPPNRVIAITIKDSTLNIFTASEYGQMSEDIQVEKTGENLEKIMLNVKFVQDVLKGLKGDVDVTFNGPLGPCVFLDENYRYLVLPVSEKA